MLSLAFCTVCIVNTFVQNPDVAVLSFSLVVYLKQIRIKPDVYSRARTALFVFWSLNVRARFSLQG